MIKPYVVSADIGFLLQEWALKKGFSVPVHIIPQVRAEFISVMGRFFPYFDFVPEEELKEGIKNLVLSSGLAPVSLDRVYFQEAIHLDITRIVDGDRNDQGFGNRPNTPRLLSQIRNIKEAGLKEVVLIDDVVFTGNLLERVIHCFSKVGIKVPLICVGIGVEKGIRRINHSRRKASCVRVYEDVTDEVCERDFYPGVPFSGRLLKGNENVGVPYLFPFGNPGKWASIPKFWQNSFSDFCIRQTISLFEAIEECSQREVMCSEAGRYVISLPQDGTRLVDALGEVLIPKYSSLTQ